MKLSSPSKSILLAGLGFLALTADVDASIKECSGAVFADKCQDHSLRSLDLRKSTSEADGVIFNYFLVGKREHYAEIKAFNATAPPALGARAIETAESVRKSAISYVSGNQPEATWSREVASVVERLRTVRFRLVDGKDSDCSAKGDAGIPNAAYTEGEHAIGICPGLVKSTTQEAAATIAHELGHTVSPCTMSKSLVKLLEPKPGTGACLLKIGEGEKRSAEEIDVFGSEPVTITKKSDFAVDQDPEWTDNLIRCEAAERLPASKLDSPKFYQSFNACIDKRYQTDYEDWIAFKLFHLDKMPKRFDTLPGSQREEWPKMVEALKQEVPFRCFVKNDEHFADSFGGMVYSAWGRSKDITPSQFELGLHSLTGVQCVEKVTKNMKMDPHIYPSASERIALHLKPNAVMNLLGCDATAPASLCSLTEDTFTPAPKADLRKRGTKR